MGGRHPVRTLTPADRLGDRTAHDRSRLLAAAARRTAVGAAVGLGSTGNRRGPGCPGRSHRDLSSADAGFGGARVSGPDLFLHRPDPGGRDFAALEGGGERTRLVRLARCRRADRARVPAVARRRRDAPHESGPGDPGLSARSRADRAASDELRCRDPLRPPGGRLDRGRFGPRSVSRAPRGPAARPWRSSASLWPSWSPRRSPWEP